MLEIDRAGHFVLLATGTDNINVHDTYFGKQFTSQSRDIYDFMQCNNVTARHLNCGHTGSIHSRSMMYRTQTPFFISISNRGRVLGAEVGQYHTLTIPNSNRVK